MHDASQSPVLGIILGIITIVVTKLSESVRCSRSGPQVLLVLSRSS